MSNVNAVDEMVGMITTQRAYEAVSKVVTASDEMLQHREPAAPLMDTQPSRVGPLPPGVAGPQDRGGQGCVPRRRSISRASSRSTSSTP